MSGIGLRDVRGSIIFVVHHERSSNVVFAGQRNNDSGNPVHQRNPRRGGTLDLLLHAGGCCFHELFLLLAARLRM